MSNLFDFIYFCGTQTKIVLTECSFPILRTENESQNDNKSTKEEYLHNCSSVFFFNVRNSFIQRGRIKLIRSYSTAICY